jgi:hypothetical protein
MQRKKIPCINELSSMDTNLNFSIKSLSRYSKFKGFVVSAILKLKLSLLLNSEVINDAVKSEK